MTEPTGVSLSSIVQAVSGTIVRGDSTSQVVYNHLCEPAEVNLGGAAFVISASFVQSVKTTKAALLIVQESLWESVKEFLPDGLEHVVTSADAYLGLARTSKLFLALDPYYDWLPDSFDIKDRIHPSARIHETARISAGALICANAHIDKGAVILGGAVIGPACVVGADSVIFPGCVLYPRVVVGARTRIHANAVIGADGFGYAKGPRGSEKIWHLGRVLIGDDVEIGAGTCIDRGTLRDSRVDSGAKIDNLVQVGHNGHIKSHAVICAQAGLAGNVTVGVGSILAGQAGIGDKIVIGDGAIVGPQTGISKNVAPGAVMMSALMAKPRREWWKFHAYLDRVPELFESQKKRREP